MRVAVLTVSLCLAASCGGNVSSAPPGQPTAQSNYRVSEPETWTLQQTEAQLLEDLARIAADQPHRVITVYYVEHEAAAELLGDWLQRDGRVAAVRMGDSAEVTRLRGVGNQYAGRLSMTEQRLWELIVESAPALLKPKDVTSWVQLLGRAPRDNRWRLGPSMIEQP